MELTRDGLSFKPNRLNEKAHVGLVQIDIPIATIRSVRRVFGWFTGIVIVEHERGTFHFRCYGAKHVAEEFGHVLGKA